MKIIYNIASSFSKGMLGKLFWNKYSEVLMYALKRKCNDTGFNEVAVAGNINPYGI